MVLYSWYKNQHTDKSKDQKIKSEARRNRQLMNYSCWPTTQVIFTKEQTTTANVQKQNNESFFTIQDINWQDLSFEK